MCPPEVQSLNLEEFVCVKDWPLMPDAITISSVRSDWLFLTDRLFVSGFLCGSSNVQCHQADAPALLASL